MKELRPAIIRMHQRGTAKREIARLLGIGESTVRKAIQRHEETGTNKDNPGRGRKKTARNQRDIKRVQGMIQRNPTTKRNSSRTLAKKIGISSKSVHRILREDLEFKPFKFKKRQKLTEPIKQKCRIGCTCANVGAQCFMRNCRQPVFYHNPLPLINRLINIK